MRSTNLTKATSLLLALAIFAACFVPPSEAIFKKKKLKLLLLGGAVGGAVGYAIGKHHAPQKVIWVKSHKPVWVVEQHHGGWDQGWNQGGWDEGWW